MIDRQKSLNGRYINARRFHPMFYSKTFKRTLIALAFLFALLVVVPAFFSSSTAPERTSLASHMCDMSEIYEYWKEDSVGVKEKEKDFFAGLDLVIQFPVLALDESDELWARQSEFLESIRLNIQHKFISHIHVFLDSPIVAGMRQIIRAVGAESKDKITFVPIGRQSTYRDMLEYASLALPGKIVMVANTDIIIGQGLEGTICDSALERSFFVISRHEPIGVEMIWIPGKGWVPDYSGHEKPDWASFLKTEPDFDKKFHLVASSDASFDAFLFKSPLPCGVYSNSDHPQNRWGAESTVSALMKEHAPSMELYNIAHFIHVYHNHFSRSRPWMDTSAAKERYWSKLLRVAPVEQLPQVCSLCRGYVKNNLD